jgi:superfamily I DNA/RNA helicase
MCSATWDLCYCRANELKGSSVADLLRLILEKTGYEDYLRTSQQDFDQRWENVQELVSAFRKARRRS